MATNKNNPSGAAPFQLPTLDLQALIDRQRKDLEALAQASRQAVDGVQALAARRSALAQESLAQWQAALQPGDGDPLARASEQLQQGVRKAMADLQELGQMEVATHGAAWQTLQDRFQQNLSELQQLLRPR